MKIILFIIFTFFIFIQSIAQPVISYQPIISGLNSPDGIANCNDDRLFIIERAGVIKILKNNSILPIPFLDITSKTSIDGDRGLFSIAFHPNYKNNGYFYVYYTEKSSNLRSSGAVTVERYTVSMSDSKIAEPSSGAVLLTILKPLNQSGSTFTDHNGGDLHFGKDGYLYFGTGDGGKEVGMDAPADPYHNSQNDSSSLGKLLN